MQLRISFNGIYNKSTEAASSAKILRQELSISVGRHKRKPAGLGWNVEIEGEVSIIMEPGSQGIEKILA